jgi:hypothetical protein
MLVRRIFLIGMVLLVLALGGGAIALADDATDPSPATGHAEVVAEGVESFSAQNVRWQVESVKVDPAKDPVAVAGPGFVVADKGAILVTTSNGAEARLAPGESIFLPAAGSTVTALTTTVATAKTVVLTDASKTAGSDAVLTGDPIAAPTGRRDLDLVRDVLKSKEHALIENGDATPAVILVLKGAITVKNANGGTVELTAGKAGALTGPLTVTATSTSSAAFYAGIIGPEVEPAGTIAAGGAAESPTATAEATGGRIDVVTYLCPAGVSVEAAAPETCGQNSGLGSGQFSLTGGSLESAATPLIDHGIWTWGGLDAGDYAVSVDQYPDGFADYAIDLNDSASHTGADIQVSLADGAEVTINVYFLASGEATAGGTALGLTFFDCPAGTTVDDLTQPSDPGCTEVADAPFEVTLTGDALAAPETTDTLQAVSPQPSLGGDWQWTGLPAGSYTLTIAPQADGDTFYIVQPCGDASCNQVTGAGTSVAFDLGETVLTLLVYRLPAA